jgi:hypothetical protein
MNDKIKKPEETTDVHLTAPALEQVAGGKAKSSGPHLS